MRISPLALVLALAAGAFGSRALLSQDTPLPTKIGYVDLTRVFDGYDLRAEIEKRINEKGEAVDKAVQAGKEEIEKAEDAIALLNPRSEEYAAKDREIAMMRYMLKWDQESQFKRLEVEARQEKAMLYKKISTQIQTYCESNGFAGVHLYVPVPEDLEDLKDLNLITSTRTVLWHDERLDLTDAIIEALNGK